MWQLKFYSLRGLSDVRTWFFIKEGNAFPSFVWNAWERILERKWNAFQTRSERKWNERERSVKLFLSSAVSPDN
jgi:hypothetical protein